MISKRSMFIFLTIIIIGLSLVVRTEAFDDAQFLIAVNETPALEAEAVPGTDKESLEDTESNPLDGFSLEPLGVEFMETGKYLRKTYNSYSIIPGTWRWVAREIEKGEGSPIGPVLAAIIVLPVDFTLTRIYGNFTGSYYMGRAGSHFIEASKYIPPQQANLIEDAGKNLKTCRTFGLLSTGLFYGGLSMAVYKAFTLESGEKLSDKSFKFEAVSMITGYGLRFVSLYFAGKAGQNLKAFTPSFPIADLRTGLEKASKSIEDYRTRAFIGYGLSAVGVAIAAFGGSDDTITAGVLTTIVGWIISSPVAANSIKSAAIKLDEVGDRMMYWKE